MEKNNNNSTNKESSKQIKADNLLDKIVLLKTYISLLENTIQIPKHNQLQLAKKQSDYDEAATTFHDKLDEQVELLQDFYKLAGVRCVKSERKSSFVFEISNKESVLKNSYIDTYRIEILIDDNGHGSLGDGKLPVSVDVDEILSRYPIDNINNVKHFLDSCKNYIDTYVSRVKQFTDLQDLILEFSDTAIQCNHDFTFITIKMPGIRDIICEQMYNVNLRLFYEADEIRPYKLSSICEERVSAGVLSRLNKFFKPFLRDNLCSALVQINIYNKETQLFFHNLIAKDGVEFVTAYESDSILLHDDAWKHPYLCRKNKN